MEITGATIATAPADSDGETPPRPTSNKPMGFLAYANGTHALHLKQCITNTKSQPPASAPPASYRECMRNHAAGIGGHALDGCCEFMPSPLFSPSDPTSLRCAACGCHRNFHRRHPLDPNSPPPPPPPGLLPLPPPDSPSSPPTPATLPSPPQMPVSLRRSWAGNGSGSGGGRSSSSGAGKKRFRTKFSRQQKERMYDLAGRFGWKMQKMDKAVVEEFCTEIGVGKEVLKVWLHNNKNTPLPARTTNNNNNNDASTHNNGAGGLHFQPVNASSSSSGASLS